MNNDFDFVKYLYGFVADKQHEQRKHYYMLYVRGIITKQQLDEFMEGVNDEIPNI